MPEPFIFDTGARAATGRKLRTESVFEYLNRSAAVPAGAVRELIERWYAAFPEDGRADIRGRLRSGEAAAFDSGFHELCLHDLLSQLGLTAELHPVLATSTKNPDFLVHDDAPGDFYLEAVAPTDVADPAARQRAAVLLDGLDAKLENANYWLSITVERYSAQTGSTKRFRRFVEQALADLAEAPVTTGSGLAAQLEPRRFEYNEDGWIVELAGFPKAEALRGRPGIGAIGMEFSRFEEVQVHRRLRTVLESKAKKYGGLGLPFAIAVNTNDLFGDEHELLMALFGIGATPIGKGKSRGALEVTLPHDGLWIKAATPRNTQVSGVLFTRKVSPANLGSANGTLYLNPWATHPYSGALTQLPTAVFSADSREYENRAGRSLLDILQVPPGWPSWPTEALDEPPSEDTPQAEA
jgi:hypothetical protein